MKKVNLFAYAQLKPPSKYAPKTKTKPQPASIHAHLYGWTKDAGVKAVGNTKAVAKGMVLKVTPKKFKSLSKMEKPQFKAVKTKTTKGQKVEVFKDVKKIPKNAKKIKNFSV
jgi:hypothetical protein